jgi:hypothetical protein
MNWHIKEKRASSEDKENRNSVISSNKITLESCSLTSPDEASSDRLGPTPENSIQS